MTPTSHYQQGSGGSWQSNPANSARGSPEKREIPPEHRLTNPYKHLDFGAAGLPDCMLKLVIIGDSGVGKSCLLRRFAENTYTDSMRSTVGVDFLNRRVDLDGRGVEFQLWDTAGQERFRASMVSYYRGAQGILLVYDVTDKKSFEHLDRWLVDIEKHAGKSCKRVLVGNKCDRVSERVVDFGDAQAWGVANEIEVFETSAKEGVMVDETFLTLVRLSASSFRSYLSASPNCVRWSRCPQARQIISEGGGNGPRRLAGTVGLQSIAGPGSKMPGEQPESTCC
jgi:small GTP-binding protein